MTATLNPTSVNYVDADGDAYCKVCRTDEHDATAPAHDCPFANEDLAAEYITLDSLDRNSDRWAELTPDTYDVDETWATFKHGRKPAVLPEGCENVGEWLAAVREADAPHNVWRRENYAARLGTVTVSWRNNGIIPEKAWAHCSCSGRRYFRDFAEFHNVDGDVMGDIYDEAVQAAWVARVIDHAVEVHDADIFGI